MKKEKKQEVLNEKINIPSGITADIKDSTLIIIKGGDEIKRKINPVLNVKIEGNDILVSSKKTSKKEKKIFGSMLAHVKNNIAGLTENYKYTLQIASVHFPTTAEVDKAKNEFVIKNFLGEKKDRRIKLIPGVEVKVNKSLIEVSSCDIEKAGQVASNLEKGTKVRSRDRRIFQDGIFITEKPGRKFL